MNKKIAKTILLTGGFGFIPSHIIRHIVNTHKDWLVVNLDAVTYAANPYNVTDIEKSENYKFVYGNANDENLVKKLFEQYNVTDVFHLASHSHVDNSIKNPMPFFSENIMGTANLLEQARQHWGTETGHKFYYFSTDEVFGYIDNDGKSFEETTPLNPTSPYSASKACGDLIAKAYWKTFKLPVVISHMCNAIGPNQHPEKLVPATIQRILDDEPIIVYDKGLQVREWIYTDDIVSAAMTVFEKGVPGEAYNIGSGNECKNIDMVSTIINYISQLTGKTSKSIFNTIKYVENARPGHDFRYAINHSKITNELGWKPKYTFEQSVEETVKWYIDNQDWVKNVKDGEYQKWIDKYYSKKSEE